MSDRKTLHPLAWAAIGAGTLAAAVALKKAADSDSDRHRWLQSLQQGAGSARDLGEKWLHDGERSVGNVQNQVRSMASDLDPRGSGRQQSESKESTFSQHESALAAFMATLLAKGVASYFQWRSAERARQQGQRQHHSASERSELESLTVTELRRKASDEEIDGRSNMNKEELVEALKH